MHLRCVASSACAPLRLATHHVTWEDDAFTMHVTSYQAERGMTFELWKGVVALGWDEGQVGRLYQLQLGYIAQHI